MCAMPRRLILALVALAAGLVVAAASAGGAGVTSAKREAAARWAISQVGTRERGTTNCSPKIDRWQRAMGLRVPPCRVWCGAFVHQAFLQAGVRLSKRLIDPDRSFGDAVAGCGGSPSRRSAAATSSSTRFGPACAPRTWRSPAGGRAAARWTRSRATRATPCASSAAACATSCSPPASSAPASSLGVHFAGRSGHSC
jgi:hypothetical protein